VKPTEAAQFCWEKEMQLVVFETRDEMSKVWNKRPKDKSKRKNHFKKSNNINSNRSDDFWVGAKDVGTPAGRFSWSDGRLVDSTWWQRGQPNEHGAGKESFVFLRENALYDCDPTCAFYFVCQVPAKFSHCVPKM
jgi:hypothetical protein